MAPPAPLLPFQQCHKNIAPLRSSYITSILPLVLLLLVVANFAVSQSIIKTLPGFPGDLPFKLETGYVGVGYLDDVQLFYYFVESERSPKDDPLILWLTGGPGCSGFSALVYENGPLNFNYANSSGNKPQFLLNPYSWTKVANIIFLDAPVGTGFSYATNWEGYKNIDDMSSVAQTYEFLRKWLRDHPKFLLNSLYIAGDSYSGITIPVIVQEVYNGNEVGHEPPLNLKGYVLGNPFTHLEDYNSRIKFAHRMALLSDELYESTKRDCKGEYIQPDTSNAACMDDLEVVHKCLEKIYMAQVLEPTCSISFSPKPNGLKWDQSFPLENSIDNFLSMRQLPERWCREYDYIWSNIWANDKAVQHALHVREGTIKNWERCNNSLSYTKELTSVVEYHRNLTMKDLRALIYSGDHDMVVPYVGTEEWISSLGLPVTDEWEPWFVDGQIAGYLTIYSNKNYYLTYVTVKGAGHPASQYKPMECLAMIDRWLAYYPI